MASFYDEGRCLREAGVPDNSATQADHIFYVRTSAIPKFCKACLESYARCCEVW